MSLFQDRLFTAPFPRGLVCARTYADLEHQRVCAPVCAPPPRPRSCPARCLLRVSSVDTSGDRRESSASIAGFPRRLCPARAGAPEPRPAWCRARLPHPLPTDAAAEGFESPACAAGAARTAVSDATKGPLFDPGTGPAIAPPVLTTDERPGWGRQRCSSVCGAQRHRLRSVSIVRQSRNRARCPTVYPRPLSNTG